MSDFEIVRNALGVAWSMPDAVLQHTDPRFKWWDGPLREAIDAAKPALDRLESQNQALQERAERAEALLRDAVDLVDSQTTSEQGWHDDVIDYFSDHPQPTQETDPE